jgi:hypothetical protein
MFKFVSSEAVENHKKKVFKETVCRVQAAWEKEDKLQNRPNVDRVLLSFSEERQLLSW